MKFHTVICSKKAPGSNPSYSHVNISGIKEIEELLPTEKQFSEWVKDTALKLMTGQQADLIHIKTTHEVYVDIVRSLYRKIGKSITLHQEGTTYFRIPTKKGNAFFEDIERIVLINDELRVATIVIHV